MVLEEPVPPPASYFHTPLPALAPCVQGASYHIFPTVRNGFGIFFYDLHKSAGFLAFFWEGALTSPRERDRIPSKLDRSDRGAAFISTAPARPGSRRTGKGPPPKCRDDACPSGAGPSGNTCRTVTNLCEALSMAVRDRPCRGLLSVFSMDRLTKRSIFSPLRRRQARRRSVTAAESFLR